MKKIRKSKILSFLSVISSFVCIFSFLIWTPIFLKGKLNNITFFAASTVFQKGSFKEVTNHTLKSPANDKIFIPNIINFGGKIKKEIEFKGMKSHHVKNLGSKIYMC